MNIPQFLIEWLDENEYDLVDAIVDHESVSEALEDEIAADEGLWDMEFDNNFYSLVYHKDNHALRITNQLDDYILACYAIIKTPAHFIEDYKMLDSIDSEFINCKPDIDIFMVEALNKNK